MGKSRRTGLSKGVMVVCGSSFGLRQSSRPATKRVKLNRTRKELAREKAQHQAQLASKSHFQVLEMIFKHEIRQRSASKIKRITFYLRTMLTWMTPHGFMKTLQHSCSHHPGKKASFPVMQGERPGYKTCSSIHFPNSK